MTGRSRRQFREWIADFCLFSPMGVGFAFPLSEVMEMDLDLIKTFKKRKDDVINQLSKT